MTGRPRVHGNGFLQLDLTPEMRLHIWGDPRIPRQAVATPIHDHTFGFTSRVLRGSLTDLRYQAVNNPAGLYAVHQARVREGEDTVLEPTGQRVSLFPLPSRMLLAGQTYTMIPGEIHETIPSDHGVSVSVITKVGLTLAQGGSSPRVFVPVGREPDNTFHRYAVPEAELWQILFDALSDPIR